MKNFAFSLAAIFLLLNTAFAEPQIFTEDGKKGVKDENGNILISALYDEIGWSEGGFSFHGTVTGYLKEGMWGLVSEEDVVITAPLFSHVSIKNSGHYITAGKFLSSEGAVRYGLIDKSGKTILPFIYTRLRVHGDRIIASGLQGSTTKTGVIDTKGKTIISFLYNDIKPLGALRYMAELESGKKILLNESGIRMSPIEIDSINSFRKDKAVFWWGHKAGLIDREGKILVEPLYKSFRLNDESRWEALPFPEWKSINTAGEVSFNAFFDKIERISDSTFLVSAHNKQWIINNKQEPVSQVFDHIAGFKQGLAVAEKDKRTGVLSASGKFLLPNRFTTILRDSTFFYTVDPQGKWYVYDQYGVQKNQVAYDSVGTYQKLYFPVMKKGFWGLMDRSGNELLHCVYDSIGKIQYDLIEVKFKSLYGLLDIQGNWVITPSKGIKVIINEEIYLVLSNGKTEIYSFDNDLIYFTDNILEVYDGYFLEQLSNGMVWKINFSGVIEADKISNVVYRSAFSYSEFEDIFPPSEGYSAIKKDGKYGFIDDENRLRIANRYDSVQRYSEGLAPVKLIGKWGFIDKDEQLVIQPIYDFASPFENGYSWVIFQGKYNLINKRNQRIFQTGFDWLTPTYSDRYLAYMNGRVGVISASGTILVNHTFDELEDLGNGYLLAEKLGKKGVIDLTGQYVIPRNYSEVHYDRFRESYLVKTDPGWVDLRILSDEK